ncbi:sodium channel protein Nach-like isoform X1 [Vespula squamosa]|uniref:Sodium channel protein Nach-like isoform X1 n=1 Tax=Vespula squamosa TaxID=30214 RepID=A0ABD2A7T8_VESSQ
MPKTITVGFNIDEKIEKNVRNVKKIDDQMKLKNKSTLISTNANRKKRIARKTLQDFTNSSSLHGVKYLGMQAIVTNYIGKFLWLSTIITGIVGPILNNPSADMMLKKLWQHLEKNPTEFFIETFHAPIFLAAFPAITICPNVPTMLETQMDIMQDIKLPANMSIEEAMFFVRYGAQIIVQKLDDERLRKFNAFLRENQWQLIDFLRILNPCETMIESCWWDKKKINCTDYIKQSYTDKGICCSYNYYLEHLMKYNIRFQEMPVLRTAHSGLNSGLTIIFNRDLFVEDNKTEIKNFVNTIKLLVYVHHTLIYPNAETVGYTLQKEEGLMLSVKPIIKKKPSNFYHKYINGILQAECVSNSKKSELRFFIEYQQSNCFVNCLITNIYNACGCLLYNYAPMANYTSLPLCELEDTNCLYKYMKRKKSMNYGNCLCVNLCDDTTYEISSIKYLLKETQLSVSPIYQHLSASQTILNVYWKMDFFMIIKTKSTSIGWKNIAEVGGIFSLFLGCSIISIVEILYFVYLFFPMMFTGHDNTIRIDLNSQQVDLFPAITGTWPSASLSTSSNI